MLVEAGALSDGQLREAAELLGHLNETWFGYRSGDPGRALPGEPRAEFDPGQRTLRQRVEAKAVIVSLDGQTRLRIEASSVAQQEP